MKFTSVDVLILVFATLVHFCSHRRVCFEKEWKMCFSDLIYDFAVHFFFFFNNIDGWKSLLVVVV